MRQQRTIAKSRDYSGVFLAVILLGVVAVAFEQSLQ